VTTWYKFNIVNVCQHSSTNMLNIVWTEPPTNIEEHILSKESPSFLQSSRLEVDHIQIHQIWKIFWMIWKISKTVKMFLVNSCWWQLQTLQLSDLWLLAASCLQSAILARCVPTSNHSAPIITNHHESSRIITNHHESSRIRMPYHAIPCRTMPHPTTAGGLFQPCSAAWATARTVVTSGANLSNHLHPEHCDATDLILSVRWL
jgi:hypothetical protein